MPRAKTTDKDLPACCYRKHGAIWYVKAGKWTRLGDDLAGAMAAYAKILSGETIKKTAPDNMPALLHRWLDDHDLADKTRRTYSVVVNQLSSILAEFRPDQLTARDITAVMHHHRKKPGMANHMRSVLIGALELAYMENLVERNVARDTRPLKTPKRDRYLSDQEYSAIRSKATPTLAAMMDVLYLTGQRISDIIALKHSDILPEGVRFRQQKTGNRLIVEWSPGLRSAVDTARSLHQSVKGMTLFHTREGKPFSYSTVRTLWDRATKAAGVEDANIHDLRAKSGTDADKQGLDSKTLLGHASESSHLRYLRSKETPVATPPKQVVTSQKLSNG